MTTTIKGYYDIKFQKMKADQLTESYTYLLQKTIQKKPAYWLWSHKRWKR